MQNLATGTLIYITNMICVNKQVLSKEANISTQDTSKDNLIVVTWSVPPKFTGHDDAQQVLCRSHLSRMEPH